MQVLKDNNIEREKKFCWNFIAMSQMEKIEIFESRISKIETKKCCVLLIMSPQTSCLANQEIFSWLFRLWIVLRSNSSSTKQQGLSVPEVLTARCRRKDLENLALGLVVRLCKVRIAAQLAATFRAKYYKQKRSPITQNCRNTSKIEVKSNFSSRQQQPWSFPRQSM